MREIDICTALSQLGIPMERYEAWNESHPLEERTESESGATVRISLINLNLAPTI